MYANGIYGNNIKNNSVVLKIRTYLNLDASMFLNHMFIIKRILPGTFMLKN